MTITRLYLSGWVRPAGLAGAVGTALATSVVGVRLLTESPVTPTPFGWLVLGVLGAAAWVPVLVPVSAAWGAVEALGRRVDDGSWLGMQACGGRGRSWIPATLIAGALAAAPTAAFTLR